MHSTVAVAAMGCLAGDHAEGEQVHCAGGERLRRADAGEEFQCAEPGDEQARAHPEDVDAVGDHALGDPLERACGGAEVADGSHDRIPSSRPDGIRLAAKKPDVEVCSAVSSSGQPAGRRAWFTSRATAQASATGPTCPSLSGLITERIV